jgi:hypothetical protein
VSSPNLKQVQTANTSLNAGSGSLPDIQLKSVRQGRRNLVASVTAQSGKRQFLSKMMQQSSQFRPLMHKNPRAKELLIN